MPPSGFSQPAINGLLAFVRDSYANTLQRYQGRDLSEEQVLRESIGYLENHVAQSAQHLNGFVSPEGVKGLQQFVTTNFLDLIAELKLGKKVEGKAMQTELEHIGTYLAQFKL
ncbi:MAG: hypothetical protein Q8Q31_05070 [Nanoarchaeota archaeon]|nr:hypothetical protein [Nanoarchaeota archaeon]